MITINKLATNCSNKTIHAIRNTELLRACCHQLVNNVFSLQTISNLLEQLVASLLASSALL